MSFEFINRVDLQNIRTVADFYISTLQRIKSVCNYDNSNRSLLSFQYI